MGVRTRLDEIEDMNFAIDQMVYKGFSADHVKMLLVDRGVDEEKALILVGIVENKFPGIKRIQSSKPVRFLGHLIDNIVLFGILMLLINLGMETEYLLPAIFAVPGLYFILTEWLWGRTIGKWITGTVVVNEHAVPPGLGSIIGRTFCRLIPFDVFFMLMYDYALHDKLSETHVVNKEFWENKYEFEEILHD
jgi:hypothetical protein